MGFGEEDSAVFGDDVGGGDGKAPAWFAVDEGNVDEDGLVVAAVILGDGVDEAELFGEFVAGVAKDGEGEAVLAGHEVTLALGLRADGDHEGFALADGAIKVAPGFKLSDAVRAPAAAEKLDDEGAEGEHVGAADEAACGVQELEFGGGGSDGENAAFNTGVEELGDCALADGQALGLDQVAGVGGDLVELVLEASWHRSSEGNH